MNARRARRHVGLAASLALAAACGMRSPDVGFANNNNNNSSSSSAPDYDAGQSASQIPSLVASDAGLGAILDAGSLGPTGAGASPSFAGPLAGPFTDFPADPILDAPAGDAGASTDAGAPSDAAQLFGPSTQGAASGFPCLLEPEIGSLYPNNWLRPRFAWRGDGSQNVFELRVHADNQANDLVVYTTASQWTMPEDIWSNLSAHSQDVPMTVSVRGGTLGQGAGAALTNESLGSSGPIGIAPVSAPGSIVYWAIIDAANGSSGLLKGFHVGDEGVEPVLDGSQVQVNPPTGNQHCIGCHTSTPDGLNVAFSSDWSNFTNSIATIAGDGGAPGAAPSFLTADARKAIGSLGGVPAFSHAHWAAGDRIELLSDTGDLHWVNLEASGAAVKGIVARNATDAGDPLAAVTPAWTHDGATIVYSSLPADGIATGRPNVGPMDLYAVPYNGGAGGDAVPVPGAAEPDVQEIYPAISPDDAFIAFDSASGSGSAYANPADELSVIPLKGGTPTRLAANDPPACSGASSPGVTNSWPKWSPSAERVPVLGKTYYWLVFSSTRVHIGDPQHLENPQLYITPVVVDDDGTVTTYNSLYLWNQPFTEDNHTPAWDVFQIPRAPAVPR
jgi:hypothetical protein